MSNGNKIFMVAFVLVLFGAIMTGFGFTPPAELKTGADIDLNNLDSDYAYYLKDMELFDEYATLRGGDGDTGSYYIGLIETANEDYYLFSVYVDNDKEWKEEARDHNFTNINMSVPACYSCKKITSMDEDLQRYYRDYTDELIANSTGLNVVNTGLHVRFVCNEEAEYEDAASNLTVAYVGIVFVVLGIILFPVSKKVKKKEAEAAARAAEAAAAAAAYYNPESATPMYYDPSQDSTTNNNGPEF